MECESESSTTGKGKTCACGSGKSYEDCCGSENCQTMDPVEHAKQEWHKAFFQAMHEAHVERLRKRIESLWGPSLDEAADAVIESFGKYWQSMVKQSEAKIELDSKFRKIFSEASGKA